MKTITCKCGKQISVDDEDYAMLNQYNWSCTSDTVATTSPPHPCMAKMLITSICDVVDHRDRDIHNNQKFNLRPATYSENNSNKRIQRNNKSGYKGVCFEKRYGGYWRAYITKNKVTRELGKFKTAEDAAVAYNKAALELHGEFASYNVV